MRPGEVIAGRFEVVRSVRSGGLSVVFQARDRRTSQEVALKIINIQPSEEALLKRIEREIKILTSLSHPHVVGCIGSGALPDGRPYLVLDWLEGEDLADFKMRAPMTLRRVLEVAGQVSDALAAGHTLGIIHRDVKPANIFLVKPHVETRPDCRVIDFGVAKMPQASASITRAGAILGTPSYMAPEQASYAMDVDARADVFSLGVVTFELLTGRLPWQSSTDLARLARILVEPAVKVHEVSPDVPDVVAQLVDHMLMLKVNDRIATARAVHDRVLAALAELPEGLLDTTFTRDAELLQNFVREDTADIPPPLDPKKRSHSVKDLKTEGLVLGPGGLAALEIAQRVDVIDVQDNRPRAPSMVTEALDSKHEVITQRPESMLEAVPRPGSALSARRRSKAKKSFIETLSYVEAPDSVLFGRVQELDGLRSAISRPINTQRPSYVLVSGPAGIGKTRVRGELTRIVRGFSKAPLVLAGRAEEVTQSSPYSFLRRMLNAEARIHSDDPPDKKRAKMLSLMPNAAETRQLLAAVEPHLPRTGLPEDDDMAALEDHEMVASFLARALHIPYAANPAYTLAERDPRLMGDHVRRAFDVVFRNLASKTGVVFLVDDAHFLDHQSALVLRELVRPERQQRAVLVAFALPQLLEGEGSRSPLAGIEAKSMELEPLDSRASREFARSLVRGSVESSALELMIKRAAGNPLYLEQLVLAVQANGSLQLAEGGEYELRGLKGDRTDDDRVPPTVAAAVAARISRMKHHQQRVLATAAVFGDVFWVEGVARLLDLGLEEATMLLDNLQLANLVRRRQGTRYRDQIEMEFAHGVIRSVALSRLKRRRRHKLERAAVEYLESVGENDRATLALHVAHSGQIDRAASLFSDAAEEGMKIGAFASAGTLAEEGLLLTESGATDPATRPRLLQLAEQIALWAGEGETSIGALEALESMAANDADRARLFERRAQVAHLSRRLSDGLRYAEEAVARYQAIKSVEGEARARITHAEISEAMRDGKKALRELASAHAALVGKNDPAALMRTTRGLARIAVSSGDYRTAENRFKESLTHAEVLDDREGSFTALLGLAEVARLVGDAAGARARLQDCARFCEHLDRYFLFEVRRATLSAEEGRAQEAVLSLERVIAAAQGKPASTVTWWCALIHHARAAVEAAVESSQLEEIAARLLDARDAASIGAPALIPAMASALAEVESKRGRHAQAKTLAGEAVRRFGEEGAITEEEPPRIWVVQARVLKAARASDEDVRGAWKTAIEELDRIASRLDRKYRGRYLERSVARAVLEGAEGAGLKLSRQAESHRIAASEP